MHKNKLPPVFSAQLGVLPTNNLAGDPIYISIRNTSTLPVPEEEGKKKKKIDGVIYNVPGKGNVTVSYQGKKLFNDEMSFTQFGHTEVLVDGLFDKKNQYTGRFQFYDWWYS